MKWTRAELESSETGKVTFDEDVTIDPEAFDAISLINSVRDVHVDGSGYLDASTGHFYSKLHVTGTILCPDAISGEEIEYPFETDSEDVWSFDDTDEDDVRVVTGEVIDMLPAVTDAIIMEAPLDATETAPEDYPSGDGWQVISEEEYERRRREEGDPRLAKLREFRENQE